MFFNHKPDAGLVILLTGLGHVNVAEVKERGGDRYVTAVLNTLLAQLQPISRIDIVSFEKHAATDENKLHYEESVKKLIASTEFAVDHKDKISLSFRNIYLTILELTDAKYLNAFIVNFAGTEISTPRLLNYPRFVDVSLYHRQPMQSFVLSKLIVEKTPGEKTTPYFLYNNGEDENVYVIDRRKYSIEDREIQLSCQVSRLQLDEAILRKARAEIAEKKEDLLPIERQAATTRKKQAEADIKNIRDKAKKWRRFTVGRSGTPIPDDIKVYSISSPGAALRISSG